MQGVRSSNLTNLDEHCVAGNLGKRFRLAFIPESRGRRFKSCHPDWKVPGT